MELNNNEKLEKNFFFKNKKGKKYILTNFFEEVNNKNNKNLLPNQIKKYTSTINNGIDELQQEDFLDGFYNKFFYENYTQNKHRHSQSSTKNIISNLPEIKFNKTKSNTRSKFGIKKNINKKYKTNYNINNKNNFLNKTFNKNKLKLDDNYHLADLFSKENKNKSNMSRQSLNYPINIMSNTEDKNFYIKNYNLNTNIYNITEDGKDIERKLINKEKKKYFSGFKTRYKGLIKKSKKYVIDINEYINGKGGNKKTKKNVLNKYKIEKIQTVLNKINKKVKSINQTKKIKDIIEDVKQYQQKEKDVKNKFEKTEEKFNKLIIDSYNIKNRILKKFDTEYTGDV